MWHRPPVFRSRAQRALLPARLPPSPPPTLQDFPVMPVEVVGFHLKPFAFFAHNPARDLPFLPNAASKLASGCCNGAV